MIFKKVKEIKSKTGELHFRRWKILYTPWFKINLHGIYKEDEDKHLHNHPFDFFNIVLRGAYIEELRYGKMNFRFPLDCKIVKGGVYHKIQHLINCKAVYTLNIMWNFKDTWGYDVNYSHIDHKTYRELKNNGTLWQKK